MSSESLIITVGAAVGGAIAAFGALENRISQIGEASKRLSFQKDMIGKAFDIKFKAIDAFAQQKKDSEQLGVALQAQQQKSQSLGQELSRARQFQNEANASLVAYRKELSGQTGQATDAQKLKLKLLTDQAKGAERSVKELSRSFEQARSRSVGLENQLQISNERLQKLRSELHRNGIETDKLASHHSRLKKELEQEQKTMVKLGETINKLNQNEAKLSHQKNKRENLRGQRQEMRQDAMDMVAVGASVILPIKLAVDFESSMAEVRKVVDFDTPAQFKKLGDDLLELGTRIPVPAAGLAQIAASGGQLGVAAKDIPKFTETIAKMSVAFDMLPDEAGDSMAKLANVYNIPIANIGNLGDAINQLSNKSPAKARDIVQTLSRIGGTAKLFGLAESQAASLANTFVSLGKPPEVAANSINGMLTRLMTAGQQGKEFQGALKQIGYSATSLKQSIGKDAQGTLVEFINKLGQIPKEQRMDILVNLFGKEYADDVAVLVGSPETYKKSNDSLTEKDANGNTAYKDSMEREFKTRSDTTANNLQLLKGNATKLGVVIGSTLLPSINALVNDLKPAIKGFAEWADKHQDIIRIGLKFVAFLATMKIASLGVRYGFNMMASLFNNVGSVFTKLNSARLLFNAARLGQVSKLNALLQTFGISAAGAEKWATRLGKAGGAIKKFAGSKLGKGLGAAAGAYGLYDIWKDDKNAGAKKQTTMQKVGSYAQGAMSGAAIGMMFGPIGAAVGAVLGLVYTYVVRNWDKVKAVTLTKLGQLKTYVTTKFNSISNWFKGLPARFNQYARKIWDDFKNTSITKIGAIKNSIVTKFGQVMDWFKALPARFVQFGKDMINGLINGIGSMADAVLGKIASLGEGIKNKFKSVLGIASPSKVFKGFGGWVMEGLGIGLDNQSDSVVGRITSLGARMQNAFTPRLKMPAPLVTPNAPAVVKIPTQKPIVSVSNGVQKYTTSFSINDPKTGVLATFGDKIRNQIKLFKGLKFGLMDGLNKEINDQSSGIVGRMAQLGTGIQKIFKPELRPNIQLDTPTAKIPNLIARVRQDAPVEALQKSPITPAMPNKQGQQGKGGFTVHFSPTIQINGNAQGSNNVQEQVERGLSVSLREVEALFKRLSEEQLRKAF